MYCSDCDMMLDGAGLSWQAIDAIYGRPGAAAQPIAQPAPQPIFGVTDDEIRRTNTTSPASGFVPSGFWDRNAPQMTPPFVAPSQDWVPDPSRPAIVGSMAPAAYAAQESAGIMPLLIAAAAAYFLS